MSIIDPKQQAHILKKYLNEKAIKIKLGHAYEAIAKINGYPNWDTFSAICNAPADSSGSLITDHLKFWDVLSHIDKNSVEKNNILVFDTPIDTISPFFNDPKLQNIYKNFKEVFENSSSYADPISDDIKKLESYLAKANLYFDHNFDLETFPSELEYVDDESEIDLEGCLSSKRQFTCDELIWNIRSKKIIYRRYEADGVKEVSYSDGSKEFYYRGDQSMVFEKPLSETSIFIRKKAHSRLFEFLEYIAKRTEKYKKELLAQI